ncbi:cation:proton antiporter [Symbiobacterium terraclitae]|uniref:cation:proton antiporter n=1 Tax=Symbiobacterium terraclitae TaxID=557451 RepID=UPI0035B53555
MSFLLETCIILLAVLVAGRLSQRLGQPAVLGQLLVGVLFGPAVLGWLHPGPLISEVAEIGVVLLMFIAGLETQFEDIKRNALAATLVAVLGVALPFVGGWLLSSGWGFDSPTAIFTGVLLVATSVSISAQTLKELGYLRSRPGVTILAAAVLDDVLGIIVLSVVLGSLGASGGGGHGAEPLPLLLGKMAGFFAVAIVVGYTLLPAVMRRVARMESGLPLLTVAISVALAFAWAAEFTGLAGIIGSYLVGLMLSLTELREKIMHEVEHIAYAFFVPFFFANVGLSATFAGMAGSFLVFVIVLVLVAVATKIVGCGAGALLARFPLREATGVGVGMMARGEVGLIVATIGLDAGLLPPELYTGMVFVSLGTTLLTPPLLKMVFRARPLPFTIQPPSASWP